MSIFNLNELKEKENNLKINIEKLENDRDVLQEKIKKLDITKNVLLDEIEKLSNKKDQLDKEIENRQDFFIEAELKYMDNLSGLEFEKYCTDILIKNGFSAITTKVSGDDGGDIVASKDDITYIIQCKNYADTVGNKAVQEVYTAKGIYKTQKAIVMTNNYFTNQATKEANILEIELWNRDFMKYLIRVAHNFNVINIDIMNQSKKIYNDENENEEISDTDPYLMEAIEAVIETGQASTSFIQRRFKLGYARAGRIIDQMEERGIISGYQGSIPRKVLITKERWNE